ncbi:hypothetical protein Bca52824_076182 [Brassica carinata]|uniref:Uncharacterized protein n=1 Tax=Brassica carinata TaxID=52824 RepID=A0A8X7PTH5_BRACI|nr:hypothetical protein Bca52824_076182 [Brassica carinata]
MSFTIPMISLDWRLPEIALKSVEMSVKTLSFGNSRICTMQKANRIAITSAIKRSNVTLTQGSMDRSFPSCIRLTDDQVAVLLKPWCMSDANLS